MRRLACLGALAALLLVVPGFAAGGTNKGRYRGIETALGDGNGSDHVVSFIVRGRKLRRLVILPGDAYCYPPGAGSQSGFAPGFFGAPSPRLSGFPPAKLRRRGHHGKSFVNVTYRRVGSRWRITRSPSREDGPGFLTLAGSFKRKRFKPRGVVNLDVQYGADAEGNPTFARGPQQCGFAGNLSARRR